MLEWQLHIPVLIIIIDILPPIMHGKKFEHTYAIIPAPMFHVMGYQHWEFEQLAQARSTEEKYGDDYI
jgi:hypothetical protein